MIKYFSTVSASIVSISLYLTVGTIQADSFDSQVSRAFFTTKLKNNVPVNEVLVLENDKRKVFFYSEVENMRDKMVIHRWEHQGEKIYEKKFKVSKVSEGLISSYKLSSARTGEWMVIISDENGMPIKAVMFKYVKKGSFAGKGIIPVKR